PNPAQTLQGYLQSAEPLVIELRTDVDLGALNNQNRRPLINPELIASNLGVIRIASNKTLFSDRGATLRHGTLRIDNTQNIIIRNLKFRGLWEWDDSTRGAYDLQGWDLIEVSGGRNVWIDHCDFAKAYDGQVDVVRGADLVTVSFSRFTGDLETEVVDQIDYLESLYQANPGDPRISYYSSLRQAGQSVQQILTHEIPQDKTSLVGNGDGAGATDNGRLNVTYHHNAFTLIRQRTPRMRFGNAHVYNIMVDDIASAPFPGTQTAVNSTTNAAVLVENSEFLEVRMPFAFSNGGRISQRGSVWQLNGAPRPIDPARLSPVDPNALIWNPPLSFIWTDRTKLPYAYTLSPVDFVRTHLNQVGTITPVDAADQALLRGYLPLTAPVENPDGPPPPSPPTITTQPASRSATVGDSVIFSVVADGTAPLSYQWKKDGSDISGATGANLTLTSVQLADAGSYSVEIGNEAGIATSDPAILTIEVASVSSLRERFADGDRTTQNLPDSTAWFTSSGSNNLTATVGQATQIVSSSRTLLSYFTDSAAAPVSVGLNQTLTLDFTVQFTGFDTAASVGANTFIVGLLRSVANPAAVSGTGFVADGPPNTNARVSGDFGSNNPGSNVFNNYGGYAAMTYTGVSGTNTPVRLYARTGASASLLNSTGPFTQLTGAAATPSAAMVANVDYRGTFTLQHTAAGMAVTYTLRDPINDSIVMTHSAVQPGSSLTEFETVAFYLSKASASAGYNFIIKAVDVTLSGSEQGDSPVITTEPVSQTVPVGANASFMAVAEGAPPLSYQWQKNGSPIAGATATVLALTNVQAADAGGYRVVVSNAAGSTTSATAMLTVDLGPVAPTITSQPASQVVAVGSNAGFTVLATGTGPLSYQWFKDGSPLAAPDAATLNLTNVQPSDAGSYRVVVSNGVGSTTSNPATLIASDTLPDALYNLAGFARSATGGGLLPETDPNYRKVFTADDLVTALANKSTKVIEIMNDLNLGFNEVPATARRGALRANSAPLLHPVLLTTGVSLIDIQDKNGLTIFSANGATIRHATFNVKRATNVLIRNLKFDELWEWDESSKGKYDKQGWDFITVDMDSDQVVIDHCTFTKAYDGVVDIKGGTKNVTISWSSFVADDGGPNSFVRQQIAALESNRAANPMYDFLRTNGFSIEDIVAITRSQKKGHLIGANELDTENANHQVTLHHNYYLNMQDRLPRLRAGNSHAYNILVDNTEAFAAKNLRDTIVAAMTPSNAARLSSTYSFDVTLNGSISTEGGAVLLEKSQFVGVKSPLRNNQKDAAQAQFTGKILALDTLYRLDGPIFRGDSTTPGSPLAPVPAPALEFSWNGFVSLPYVYTTHDPTALPSLLSGGQGAGAGKLLWARENWLKTSY
ncbi:MAG TPA: immunoglobulin domain-containing protein, partial [Blastocatellia bacterium]|nr:immunoglobulin domain-containing protein [Blastocatellia bacterium]